VAEGLLITTLESVLRDLSGDGATGCLLVRDNEGDESEVYLRDGLVYAVAVPSRRATLGARLMSSGALTPDALADALEIQRNELQGWRLGELLVHLGYVDREVVEAFVLEQLKDSITDLLDHPVAGWKFRKGRKTRQDVAPPTALATLLHDVETRRDAWQRVVDVTGGPDGIPFLASSSLASDDVVLDPNDWALLCKVDGERSITQLATDCGFTLFEAGSVVVHLVDAGLVEVPLTDDEELAAEAAEQADPAPDAVAAPGDDTDDGGSTHQASAEEDEGDDAAFEEGAADPGALAASIARLAASLSPAPPAPQPATDPEPSDELAARRADRTVLDDAERLAQQAADSTARAEVEHRAREEAARQRARLSDEQRRREAETIATMLAEQSAKDMANRAAQREAKRLADASEDGDRMAREESERVTARAAAQAAEAVELAERGDARGGPPGGASGQGGGATGGAGSALGSRARGSGGA
jgi:hypothetical protein